jgi:transposase-like protein
MGKHKKWTLEDKVKIVKEFKKGATISYLNNKYDISGCGTISRWNKEYDEGKLGIDNRGKRKYQTEIEDIDILKKSYALLMKIRSQQHK